jgi:hypothetical protein
MKYKIMWDLLGIEPRPLRYGTHVFCSERAALKFMEKRDGDRSLNDIVSDTYANGSGFIFYIEKEDQAI